MNDCNTGVCLTLEARQIVRPFGMRKTKMSALLFQLRQAIGTRVNFPMIHSTQGDFDSVTKVDDKLAISLRLTRLGVLSDRCRMVIPSYSCQAELLSAQRNTSGMDPISHRLQSWIC